VAGQHHHRHLGEFLFELMERLQTVHSRQNHIQCHQIGFGAIECAECFFAVGDREHVVTLARHQGFHVIPHTGVIIDHQNSKPLSHQSFL